MGLQGNRFGVVLVSFWFTHHSERFALQVTKSGARGVAVARAVAPLAYFILSSRIYNPHI